jgi:type IV secretion system protein VirD4
MTLRDKLVGTASVLGIALSTWGPTYWLAATFGYHSALGGWKLFGVPIYYPGQLVSWAGKWGAVYQQPFMVAGAAMLVGLTACLLLARLGRADGGQEKPPEFGERTWGTLNDAKKAGLLDDKGVVLGKLDGRLLTHHGAEAVLVIGATRSGKGRGTVIPTLLSHPASAFILDPKEELFSGVETDEYRFEGTSGWRSIFSHCIFFNPLDRRSARFNPMFEVRKGENEVGDAQVLATILTDPSGADGRRDVWEKVVPDFYAGLILHQLYAAPDSEKTLAGIRRQLVRPMEDLSWEMMNTLHLGDRPHPVIRASAYRLLERAKNNERYLTSVLATADSNLTLFDNPIVEWTTATSQWRMCDVMCSQNPVSVYLSIPASDEDVLIPLLRIMMTQFLKVNTRHLYQDNRGRKKLHDCLIVADEFPALKRMSVYETMMKRFAQYRIKSFKTIQTDTDLAKAYGDKSTIAGDCHIKVAFASADEKTQKNLSSMMGKDTEYRQAENFQGSRFGVMLGNKSVVTNEVYREVVTAGDVHGLDPDHEYLLVTGYPKFKAEKVRYDQEPVFRERLLPTAPVGDGVGNYPDLPGDVEIEWLGMRAECPPKPMPIDPKKPPKDAEKPAAKAPRTRKAKTVSDEMAAPPEWAEGAAPQPLAEESAPSVVNFSEEPVPVAAQPSRRQKRTLVLDGDKSEGVVAVDGQSRRRRKRTLVVDGGSE